MFPLYTKTFGGKIWKHLHSGFPDNFFDKNFNGGTPVIFPARKFQHIPSLTQTNEKFIQSFAFLKKLRFWVHNYLFVLKMVYFMMISFQS